MTVARGTLASLALSLMLGGCRCSRDSLSTTSPALPAASLPQAWPALAEPEQVAPPGRCVVASRCPAGSVLVEPGLCDAIEAAEPPASATFTPCHYRWNEETLWVPLSAAAGLAIDDRRVGANDQALARALLPRLASNTWQSCAQNALPIPAPSVPEGYYIQVIRRASDPEDTYRARLLSVSRSSTDAAPSSVSRIMVSAARNPDGTVFLLPLAWDSSPTIGKGEVEQRLINRGPEPVYVDTPFADESRRPRGIGDDSVLRYQDGASVRIGPGKQLRLTYPPASDAPTVAGRALVVGPESLPSFLATRPTPQPAVCSQPVRCPEGTTRAGTGCRAWERLLEEEQPAVATHVECHVSPGGECKFLRFPVGQHPPERLPPAEALALVEQAERAGRPVLTIGGEQRRDMPLTPGAYLAVARPDPHSKYAGSELVAWHRRDVLPGGRDELSASVDHPSMHCPHVAFFRASTGLYGRHDEILSGGQGEAIYRRIYQRKAAAQAGLVRVRITETEPEVAFLDQLTLLFHGQTVFPVEGGAASVLGRIDGSELELEENRHVTIHYQLPERVDGEVDLELVAAGRYRRTRP